MKMAKSLIKFAFVASLIAVTGCASPDTVMFGTTTVYGLDVDTVPTPNLSLGVDRAEYILAPRYENGAIPPIVASVKLKGGMFGASASQIYATGNAAGRITGTPKKPSPALKGKRKLMVFGTYTNVGFKVSFVGNAPKSVHFGFKRQEFSIIPIGIGSGPNGTDTYGSVLAAIDTNAGAKKPDDTKFEYIAFFATGEAADNLAGIQQIQDIFQEAAAQDVKSAGKTDGTFGPDENTSILKNFIFSGGKFNRPNSDKVRAWMDSNNLNNVKITWLVFKKIYTSQRAVAVKALKLK